MGARSFLGIAFSLLLFPAYGYDWIALQPCGIKTQGGLPGYEGHRFSPAPNLRVIWVRASQVVSVWGYVPRKGGIACSNVEIINGHRAFVVGTEKEVLRQLRGVLHESVQ